MRHLQTFTDIYKTFTIPYLTGIYEYCIISRLKANKMSRHLTSEKVLEEKTRKQEVKSMNGAKLTEKQKRFCDYYITDPNATAAAIKGGYSEKTAYSMGQRLLKNVEI